MTRPLRIALLTHSTNPRGGVVHALALGDALTDLGHEVAVHAPDPQGAGFFRPTRCQTVAVAASPCQGGLGELVETRIDDYLRHFSRTERVFDVYHAGDGISGSALADLKAAKTIPGFARTVHHFDAFSDPHLAALQDRSIAEADALFAVSDLVREEVLARFGRDALHVGNGVDRRFFLQGETDREECLRRTLGLGEGPVFLSVGGVEERKNSLALLEAFIELRRVRPEAKLIVAGGASLLDHQAYQGQFLARLRTSGLPTKAVIVTGPLPEADMPALYRVADALVFPSLKEGFGLVVLEAMACELPVVVSSRRPFLDYLDEADAVWCDPQSPSSIAGAMLAALAPPLRRRLIERGFEVAARHDWCRTALRHIPAYLRLTEGIHA